MVVLVVLIVLSMLGYTISAKVSTRRQRQQFMIDYQAALYARDSAVKYALATLEDINEPNLIVRADAPDFSDTFKMSDSELKDILSEWAESITMEKAQMYIRQQNLLLGGADANGLQDFNDINDINDFRNTFRDINDLNDANIFNLTDLQGIDFNDANLLHIPGPYGAPWPLIAPPMEFEIGTAKVRVEIHDENAKYPLGWAMLEDPEIRREVAAGFETFCEWMDVEEPMVEDLEEQLLKLNETKKYQLNFTEIKQTKREKVQVPPRRARTRRARRSRQTTRYRTTVTVIPDVVHYSDFSRLFNSPAIDTETLARPTIISDERKESALKYISVWGANKVNVNSAPRQVLESAFIFGGDAKQISQSIIEQRKLRPFVDIGEIRHAIFRYSDSVDKCKEFIATRSDFFTIRVTATSGVARTAAVIAVRKINNKLEKVAVLSG